MSSLNKASLLPLELLDHIDSSSRQQIEETQTKNLKALLSYVGKIPFYQEQGIGVVKTLAAYPFLTAKMLAESAPPWSEKMLSDQAASGLVLRSGGSSGTTKTIFHSWSGFRKVATLGARGLRSGSNRPIQRIANCLSAGSLWGGFIFGQGVAEALDCQVYPLGGGITSNDLLEILSSFKIDTLIGIPSLIDLALGRSSTPSLEHLQRILYVGEKFTKEQAIRVKQTNPHLKIHSLAYSTNETGPIGYQCVHQTGSFHHLHEDAVWVEIIEPEGSKAITGSEPGELVVTTLGQNLMPLIRYRMGDLVRYVPGNCPCGSLTKTIELLGRVDASAKVFGAMVQRSHIINLLKPDIIAQPEDIQLLLLRSQASTKVVLKILVDSSISSPAACASAATRMAEDKIFADLLSEIKGLSLCIECCPTKDFRRTPGSGKRPFFLDTTDE